MPGCIAGWDGVLADNIHTIRSALARGQLTKDVVETLRLLSHVSHHWLCGKKYEHGPSLLKGNLFALQEQMRSCGWVNG